MRAVTPIIAALLFLAGCGSLQEPDNREEVAAGGGYQALYRDPGFASRRMSDGEYKASIACQSNLTADNYSGGKAGASARVSRGAEVLSIGDLVAVFVEDDETFSGTYVVRNDGSLRLPFARAVPAAGATTSSVEARISEALLDAEFYEFVPRVSVILKDYAHATVFVSGAVFVPSQVTVGTTTTATRDEARQEALGAATLDRSLSAALRAAGGVRPDADLSRVTVIRGGTRRVIDIRGAVRGLPFEDPTLVNGDQIRIPTTGCFQDFLVVPSSITTPGVRVFMSNLTAPADSNAEAAVSRDARDLRYGTRFLQAVFGMNCFGGSKLTNANRRAVLFSRNPISGESVVIERRIEDLLRNADRDFYDPYILPEDALACYDSTVISLTDLAAAIGIVGAAVLITR